jgi:predicted nucleic acid-binding protein
LNAVCDRVFDVPQKTYIETTIISYLAARPSSDPLTRVHQDVTREWWDRRRSGFELYVSEVVLDEAARGDQSMARARLAFVESFPILAVNDQARQLAAAILRSAALPQKAAADAMHIAVATVNAMEFLLTWNCTHIANAIIFRRIADLCRGMGYDPPAVCTPEELS